MASIRIIFHQSPSIRPSTGKHGELSLATHRAQPHPRQPRYQLQNVWLSPLRNTIVHNNTVLQNTVFYHYVCKAVQALCTVYDFFFFRARESRELARKRSAPRELQATTELRYPSGRPAISSRYRTATVAVPFSTFRVVQRLGGRGCNKFVPVLGGDGAKIIPPGDLFYQPPGEMNWIRGKLADHAWDHVVLSPEGVVLVSSPGTESSYPRPPNL